MKKTIKSMTLIEIMIVLIIVSSWLLITYLVLNWFILTTEKIKKNIIAINLAREWIEWVFNLRDSNRNKYSWKKDECFLINEINTVDDCETKPWLSSGSYILIKTWTLYNKILYLSSVTYDLNIRNWINSNELNFWICFSWEYYNCRINPIYFREIKILWIWDKYNNVELNCNQTNCRNNIAKELRFCSKVEYIWWKVELCSFITNYK